MLLLSICSIRTSVQYLEQVYGNSRFPSVVDSQFCNHPQQQESRGIILEQIKFVLPEGFLHWITLSLSYTHVKDNPAGI